MPSVVIKPVSDVDEYVVWSTVTESPHAYGNRAEMVELLRSGIRDGDPGDARDPDRVLRSVDLNGSSAMGGWAYGHWDDDEFIFKQAGCLPRADMARAARLMCEGRERDVLDLLTPFEDDEGGAHLAECKRRAEQRPSPAVASGDGRRVDGEIATANAARAHIKGVFGGWNSGPS